MTTGIRTWLVLVLAVVGVAVARVPARAAVVDGNADADAEADADADVDADGEPEGAPDPVLDQEEKVAFENTPTEITDAELDKRPADRELVPSLTAEQLREMVKVVRAKVLARMQHKMEASAEAKMATTGRLIRWLSLAGLLLLAAPLVLRKRYPGRGAQLLKYAALAAVTFVVTINLFGAVVLGYRTAQGAIGTATNPQLRIAAGFFDTLDANAPDYLVMGKELFAPTLEQLRGNTDAQPATVLIENGKKIVKDATVFIRIAHAFKRLDIVFAVLPTVLLFVTMVLFVLAIRPTLTEIVLLPTRIGEGDGDRAGAAVVRRAFGRVFGELLAMLATLGVLVVLTVLSGIVLGRVVGPALDALIGYFVLGINYLQFVPGASSGLVFAMLAAVIAFLVLNLAAVILSMSLALGKAQQIFQRRFNGGVPLRTHAAFWRRGALSVLVAQLVPWLYVAIASWGLDKLDEHLTAGVSDASQVPWTAIMLAGPIFLVGGFIIVFWAARGVSSLVYLARYKVPPAP